MAVHTCIIKDIVLQSINMQQLSFLSCLNKNSDVLSYPGHSKSRGFTLERKVALSYGGDVNLVAIKDVSVFGQ